MTDASLRTLERAWRASPTVEAEADYLRARVRAGDLAPEKLELAAYVGHAAARKAAGHGCCPRHQALGRDPQEGALARLLCSESPLSVHDPLPAWVRGLSRWGAEVQVRAAVAAGWVALGAEERRVGVVWDEANRVYRHDTDSFDPASMNLVHRLLDARRAIEAAEAWLCCPCEEHRIAAARALLDARPVDGGLDRAWLPTVPTRFKAGTHPTRGGGGWGEEPAGFVPCTADVDEWNHRAVDLSARLATPGAVRTAISQHLTSWALG